MGDVELQCFAFCVCCAVGFRSMCGGKEKVSNGLQVLKNIGKLIFPPTAGKRHHGRKGLSPPPLDINQHAHSALMAHSPRTVSALAL